MVVDPKERPQVQLLHPLEPVQSLQRVPPMTVITGLALRRATGSSPRSGAHQRPEGTGLQLCRQPLDVGGREAPAAVHHRVPADFNEGAAVLRRRAVVEGDGKVAFVPALLHRPYFGWGGGVERGAFFGGLSFRLAEALRVDVVAGFGEEVSRL